MANYRRSRLRGHDPLAQFKIKEARAIARGQDVKHVETPPEEFEGRKTAPEVKKARKKK